MWIKTSIECDWPVISLIITRRTERSFAPFFDFFASASPQEIASELEKWLWQIEEGKYKHCVVMGIYRPYDRDGWAIQIMHPTFPRSARNSILPEFELIFTQEDGLRSPYDAHLQPLRNYAYTNSTETSSA